MSTGGEPADPSRAADDPSARLAKHYSALAPDYVELWAPVLRPYTMRLLDRLPFTGARRVLDLGTGVGTMLPELAARAPGSMVVGVDLAVGMLHQVAPGVPLAAMDIMRPAFAPGSFDAILSAFVLFNVPDVRVALERTRELLRPGGWFGMTSWGVVDEQEASAIFVEELDRAGAEPAPPASPARERLNSERKMAIELKDAGFVDVDVEVVPFDERWNAEGYRRLLSKIGGTRTRLDSLPEVDRRRVLDRVDARFETLLPDAFVDRDQVVAGIARSPD